MTRVWDVYTYVPEWVARWATSWVLSPNPILSWQWHGRYPLFTPRYIDILSGLRPFDLLCPLGFEKGATTGVFPRRREAQKKSAIKDTDARWIYAPEESSLFLYLSGIDLLSVSKNAKCPCCGVLWSVAHSEYMCLYALKVYLDFHDKSVLPEGLRPLGKLWGGGQVEKPEQIRN